MNSPIIKDRDEYLIINKDEIKRYEIGLADYCRDRFKRGVSQTYVEWALTYDAIFTSQTNMDRSIKEQKQRDDIIKSTDHCGIYFEYNTDKERSQICNNIDEDYVIRNKSNIPHMKITWDRNSMIFAYETQRLYDDLVQDQRNVPVLEMYWRSNVYDNITYNWNEDICMTDLPTKSPIKEVIFQDIIIRYTEEFRKQYTSNNIVHWKEPIDMTVILDQFFKNNYECFQDTY